MHDQSPEIDKLAAALVAFQAEAENVSKNSQNPHLKNRYADLAQVRDSTAPLLAKHGLAVIQPPAVICEDKAAIRTILVHSSGQWIAGTLPVLLGDAKGLSISQVMGSGISYARRYSYQAITGLASEDDDGQSAGVYSEPHRSTPPSQPSRPAPAPQRPASNGNGNGGYGAPKTAKQLFPALIDLGKASNFKGLVDAVQEWATANHDMPNRMVQWPDDFVATAYEYAVELTKQAGAPAPAKGPVVSRPSRVKKTPDQLRGELDQAIRTIASANAGVAVEDVDPDMFNAVIDSIENFVDLDRVEQLLDFNAASPETLTAYLEAAKKMQAA